MLQCESILLISYKEFNSARLSSNIDRIRLEYNIVEKFMRIRCYSAFMAVTHGLSFYNLGQMEQSRITHILLGPETKHKNFYYSDVTKKGPSNCPIGLGFMTS